MTEWSDEYDGYDEEIYEEEDLISLFDGNPAVTKCQSCGWIGETELCDYVEKINEWDEWTGGWIKKCPECGEKA